MSEFSPRCLLVTGGAGFIGSNLIRWLLRTDPRLVVVNLDVLTYAGNLENLDDVEREHGPGGDGRYYFIRADVRDVPTVTAVLAGTARETGRGGEGARVIPSADSVVHTAAESHVDRSILGPSMFVDTNVRGTLTLIEACRAELEKRPRPFRFLQVSTDEVYGSLEPDAAPFTEATALAPNSPYAASKAGADLLVRSYVHTFELPALVTRCSNNYGPYQFPEKLIPLMVTRALAGQPLPVYGDGLNIRDWLHVEDHAAAIWTVLTCGRPGEIYNVGGGAERPNIEVVRAVLRTLARPETLIRHVTDRRGHDRRYAIDATRLRSELGWHPTRDFESGLAATIRWYVENPRWWERVLNEAYRASNALYLTGT